MATVKEVSSRPVIFSGRMVKAILSSKKTQTRRIVSRPQPGGHMTLCDVLPSGEGPNDRHAAARFVSEWNGDVSSWGCPYGRPGDFLWVRETWSPDHRDFYPHFPYVYRADSTVLNWEIENGKVFSPEAKAWFPFRWRPSIHMPWVASRICLRVVSIGVERLQDITEEDAKAEGSPLESGSYSHRGWFRELWNEINGAKSNCDWESNPWVWRVEFSCVSHQED